ncbi:MAG: lipopolysaccharide biosynthesis protein [Abyssibacter sp.]|nr:lipopolysaccharide biosynthesis protein [Abyssibacter sp.]MCK5857893.1 lipopolysaccharide biosynthesis protein [Abyssibacter sp.]
MDEKARLARNTIANVVQALASAALLFGLYRYINTTLGVEQLGVWSVVLATASASRLADLGLSAGVTRFVARDRARGNLIRVGQVVDTALLTLMVVVGAALPLLYPLIAGLLPHLFDAEHLIGAMDILPYALASLWLTIVAAVFQGGLDGCQRMDLRAGLVVAGQIAMLASAIVLVPRFGLLGLAWAQIGQGLLLVIGGRAALRRALPALPRLPRQWSRPVLREMLGYGANVQAATVFMLLLDPVAKALMARFGGPAAAGYFEMANQVVMKARSVIVMANQAIVPHAAALAETEPARLTRLYRENVRLLVFVTLPVLALLIAWAGGFSWLLTGAYQPELVLLITLLSVAWGANIFAGPAYFTNMGTGQVGWNTLAHVLMGALNAGLGWLLGRSFGAHGVAFGYAIALIAGSAMLVGVYGYRHRVRCHVSSTEGHLPLIAASLTVAVLGWLMPLRKVADEPTWALIGLLLPLLVLGVSVWYHPVRRRLFESLSARRVRA